MQNSKESLKVPAAMYSISPTTVAKWKERNYVHDSAMGPKVRRSKLAYVDL
ncbi:MAG: IS481 family transposase, partial [Holosporales bacterium]|nr:IS481 family transposase [Holosporales bacterium]